MPIEQIFDKAEDAPEFIRTALTEDNGKFVFRAELPNEVTGLKSALDTERKTRAELEKQMKQFQGIDPAKAKQMIADAAKAEEDKAKTQGDWDNWKQQMQSQFDQEKTTLTAQITELERDLEAELLTSKATVAITEAKGVPSLLLPHLNAKIVIEDKKREVRIFDSHGQIRYGKDGKPMTITERVAEMEKDPIFGRCFESKAIGGTGAQNTTNGGSGQPTMTRAQFDALDQFGRMDAIKKKVKIVE